LDGVAKLKFDLKHVFIDNAMGQLRDIEEITRSFHADVLLCDPGYIGALFFYELTGTPAACLQVVPLGLSSRDTAPFGLAPNSSFFGRLRNRALNWTLPHVFFADVQRYWSRARASVGLPTHGWLMDAGTTLPLFMLSTVPGFEYPRSDLPPNVHFVGMMPPEAPREWQAPEWWSELDDARPVVHVTQGTVANAAPQLIAPALHGLAGEDVLVVVSTGGRPVESMVIRPLPANTRAGAFLSYPELLPRTAAMITNGGYGGVQTALSYGVPLAVGGTTEDKPEAAARVAWSGAGINLKTSTPSPAQVRDAVRALLDDGRYRARAQALQAEYARYDAVALAASLLEQLAATGRPVLRANATEQKPMVGFMSATPH